MLSYSLADKILRFTKISHGVTKFRIAVDDLHATIIIELSTLYCIDSYCVDIFVFEIDINNIVDYNIHIRTTL